MTLDQPHPARDVSIDPSHSHEELTVPQTSALPIVESRSSRRRSSEAEDLAADLRRVIRGEVRFNDGSRQPRLAGLETIVGCKIAA